MRNPWDEEGSIFWFQRSLTTRTDNLCGHCHEKGCELEDLQHKK